MGYDWTGYNASPEGEHTAKSSNIPSYSILGSSGSSVSTNNTADNDRGQTNLGSWFQKVFSKENTDTVLRVNQTYDELKYGGGNRKPSSGNIAYVGTPNPTLQQSVNDLGRKILDKFSQPNYYGSDPDSSTIPNRGSSMLLVGVLVFLIAAFLLRK